MLATLSALLALLPQQAPNRDDVSARLHALAARAGSLASLEKIGESYGGRPIELLTIAGDGPTPMERRPGILVLAGVDARRRLGTELALHHAERLIADTAAGDQKTVAMLSSHIVWILPSLNPDGFAMDRAGNARPLDLDRDGRTDEDAPRDLDGDGFVTQMRWKDPDGEWLVDENDPRILRKADPAKGERGSYHVAVEAADRDGDGERAEDDARGVLLHRNFPHQYDEYDRRTGTWAVSEPETKALADFVFGHRNLVMTFVWGGDDVLLEKPPKGEPEPRVQLKGMLPDDVALYERIGARYRELTGRSGASHPRMDGSPWSWLHFQVGVPAFASDVWRVPTADSKQQSEKEPGGEEEPKPEDAQKAETPQTDDAARLAWCERVGRGFVPWHAFTHPQLGEVEIGGFVQDDDHDLLPADQRKVLFDAHHAFLLETATHGPDVHVRELKREALAGGAFAIEATVVNDGDWPVLTATAQRSRRFSSPRWKLDVGAGAIVAGDPQGRTPNLDALGGRHELRWVVAADPGTVVTLTVTCDPVGGDTREVTL